MITNTQVLKSCWEKLLDQFQVEPTGSLEVFLGLVVAYSSVGRYYHTIEHIQQVLETIERIRTTHSSPRWKTANFPAIELAAWFHDIIYDPQANNNEEKSAGYTVSKLNKLTIPVDTVERVKQLILNTKTHQALADDIESQILLDSDLAILGAPEGQYKAYARSIRQEYSWMDEKPYRAGRTHVLQKFLQRERLYFTDRLFSDLEVRAKQNMQAEVAALSSQLEFSCFLGQKEVGL
ncbi:MAG TPA: hypothetical protein V6D50_18370 [Chroococcales cyanobacterium]